MRGYYTIFYGDNNSIGIVPNSVSSKGAIAKGTIPTQVMETMSN
jgi:hypothetical protein